MSDWYELSADPQHVAREREKARQLRKSQWWRDQIAKGLCHYCHQSFPPPSLTMDHIVPVARGGMSTKGNVVASCKECNNKKKLATPAELLIEQLSRKKEEGTG